MIFYHKTSKDTIKLPIIVLLFLLGHIIAIYLNIHNLILIISILISIFIFFFQKKIFPLIPVLLGLFNANLFLSPNLNDLKLEKYNLITQNVVLKGIVKNVVNKKWSQNAKLKITKVYLKGKELNLEGSIKFKNSSDKRLKSGDEVLFRGKLEIPASTKNLGAFNYKLYLRTKNIYYTMKIKHSRNIEILSKNNLNFLDKTRNLFKNRIMSFSEDKKISGFYLSILLGDKSYLDKNLKENMLSLGIIHLLAISGFHIAILFSIFYFFTLFLLRISLKVVTNIDIFKLSSVLSIIFIIFYLFLINFQTSATRAVIMISLFSLSKIFEKKFNSVNILALSALIILLFDKSAFLSIGFYLSFLAVLTFFIPIKIMQSYTKNLNKYQKFILNYLSVNISIFLVTTPLLLFTFYKVSLGQLIFNLIFIPVFSFIIYPIALFSTIFKINLLIEINYKIFDNLASILSGNYFFINPINIIQLILSILTLVLMFYFLSERKNIKILFLIFFYFLIILFPVNREKKGLNIYTLSVGNGDAILITKNNKSILIDAGSKISGNNGKRVIIPHLDYLNIKKIDYAIVTHLDEDHYGGFIDLIKENRIKTIISSLKLPPKLKSDTVNVKLIKKQKIIKLFDLDIKLFPTTKFKGDNNNSIITYFEYKSKKFLFTGDAEKEREISFIKNHPNIKNIYLLKLGHHGARKSSNIKFLKYLNPKIAIISAGKNNRFKHPHKETLEKLNKLGIKSYRTDLQGEIIINFHDKIKINLLK